MKKLTLAFTCLFLVVPCKAGTITVDNKETAEQRKVFNPRSFSCEAPLHMFHTPAGTVNNFGRAEK
jgi:hypothetical protein